MQADLAVFQWGSPPQTPTNDVGAKNGMHVHLTGYTQQEQAHWTHARAWLHSESRSVSSLSYLGCCGKMRSRACCRAESSRFMHCDTPNFIVASPSMCFDKLPSLCGCTIEKGLGGGLPCMPCTWCLCSCDESSLVAVWVCAARRGVLGSPLSREVGSSESGTSVNASASQAWILQSHA